MYSSLFLNYAIFFLLQREKASHSQPIITHILGKKVFSDRFLTLFYVLEYKTPEYTFLSIFSISLLEQTNFNSINMEGLIVEAEMC